MFRNASYDLELLLIVLSDGYGEIAGQSASGARLPVGPGTAKQPFSDSPFFPAIAFGELWKLRLSASGHSRSRSLAFGSVARRLKHGHNFAAACLHITKRF